MASRKPNFRIVEAPSHESYEYLFDDFKKDYLDPFMNKDDIRKKYEIPTSLYKEWIGRIKKSENIDKMPVVLPLTKEMQYIYKLSDSYGIRKQINGEMHRYGYYEDLEIAKVIRDKLYYSNWDEDLAKELIDKYSFGKHQTRITSEKIDESKQLFDKVDQLVNR